MDAERTMSETSGYVLNNSRTSERLANQDELSGQTPNELSSALQANWICWLGVQTLRMIS